MKIYSILVTGVVFLASLAANSQTPCENGIAGIYPCNGIDLLSHMDIDALGGGNNANDIWGWEDPNTSKEYAIIGLSGATAFVDLSNPVNPVLLGQLPTATSASLWRDIKVNNGHAYIVSEANDHGIQIFDLSRLANVQDPPVTFTEDGYFDGHGKAHNIVINEESDYAYSVGTSYCNGGLYVTDLSNPTQPVYVGCYDFDGYIHDAQCVDYKGPDPDHQKQEICFNCHSNSDVLTIVDVSDKSDMNNIATASYPNPNITHQGWLTEDHRFFLVGDEGDESGYSLNTTTHIYDVQDLDNPVRIGSYVGPNESTDHNLYTHNGLVYEANYSSGLRILDASDVANGNLTEVAYFDEYTNDNNTSYDGAWSSYPYFESGIVIISDYDFGLFVVRPSISVSPKIFLQGAFNTGTGMMDDDLRANGHIPLSEPFTGLNFSQVGGGGESINPSVLAVTGPNAVVDWVMVELRSKDDVTQVVASRNVLVQRDGDVVDLDGESPVQFKMPSAHYFVSIRHRNHLGAMTATAQSISVVPRSLDITNGSIPMWGQAPLKNVNGIYLFWAGNVINDGKLIYTGNGNDRDEVLVLIGGLIPTNTVPGYYVEDVILDGIVKYTGVNNDRDPILNNIGGAVPTNSRIEQLPQ